MTLKKILVNVLIPFIAGIAIGLLPMFLYMVDFDIFIFNNLLFHKVSIKFHQISGFTGPYSLLSKLGYAKNIFFIADNLILLIGIILGFSYSFYKVKQIDITINDKKKGLLMALLFVFIGILTALAPIPSRPQYYAMPISYLFILLIYSCSSKTIEIYALHRRLLLILVLVSLSYTGPQWFKSIYSLTYRDRWSGFYFHDISMNVRKSLMQNGKSTDCKIGTLSPLFAIESNLPIYFELSTGPFLYGVGDLLTREQRTQFVGTSPTSIGDLFNEDPPGAIIVGFYDDKPLLEYAKKNNYKKIDIDGFKGELYIRP